MTSFGLRGRIRSGRGTKGSLGTFAGVFTPSVLTILGIILFLRLGFVVGAGGLGRTLLILGIANLISILTSFSLATIATNLRVKGGGDYYLISRTLGVEFGGALGLVLFAAQSISIAFYAIGFGEAVATVVGGGPFWLGQAVAAGAVMVLFVLAYVGADAATRFQFVVMAILAAALIAFFAGGLPSFSAELLRANWKPSGDQSFWILFAIFFPAVTGFTQGVSMSGDLADPARSLPLGTFLAVGVSIAIYFGVAVVFAGTTPGTVLANDLGAMRGISIAPWLIDSGVIAATLSSALASFLGAPRILQSLARDRVFPLLQPFAAGAGAGDNPRRGVLLSLVIALATVAVGRLDVIAPIVSMFFLISYGLINFATYYESKSKSPSFRPTFRWHHPNLSLLGAVACGAVMLAIDPLAGAVAGAVLFGILQYVRRTVRVARWADSGRSRRLQLIRENLVGLDADHAHPRDWRPVILAFSEHKDRREALLRFASWIEGGSGFVTAVRIVEADEFRETPVLNRESELEKDIQELGITAFTRVVPASHLQDVLPTLLTSHGIGALRANTVLVNHPRQGAVRADGARLGHFVQQLRTALGLGCNLVVLDSEPSEIAALDATAMNERRIDVWFRVGVSSRLALLLAYLTTRTGDWKDATIRLLAARPSTMNEERTRETLREMLSEVRIDAEPVVVEHIDLETVVAHSRDASLVFLPLSLRGDEAFGPGNRPLVEYGEGLPVVAFFLAAQDIELDADPEEMAPEQPSGDETTDPPLQGEQ
jgi:amino acid transporter